MAPVQSRGRWQTHCENLPCSTRSRRLSLMVEQPTKPGKKPGGERSIHLKIASANCSSHAPRLVSHCEPGMHLRSGSLSLGESPLLCRDALDIAAGQRPDRIIGRDHGGNEILDFAVRFIVWPKPDADPRFVPANEPARRWISELDFGAHSPHPFRDRSPPRRWFVVRIHDDTHHLPTRRLEFRSNCIAQRRVAILVHDVEWRFRSEALPIEVFNDVSVILAFHQENALP